MKLRVIAGANVVMCKFLFLFILIPYMSFSQTETILTGSLNPSVFDEIWAEEWSANKKAYNPDAQIIDQLRNINKTVVVNVVLGTWCADSKQLVPEFLKVAALSGINFELIAVNREKDCPLQDCSTWDIKYVPTFIVLVDGVEAGRIVETVNKSVEADMLRIISNK
jgi:thiol-disulfide isomerase/thioredoxin